MKGQGGKSTCEMGCGRVWTVTNGWIMGSCVVRHGGMRNGGTKRHGLTWTDIHGTSMGAEKGDMYGSDTDECGCLCMGVSSGTWVCMGAYGSNATGRHGKETRRGANRPEQAWRDTRRTEEICAGTVRRRVTQGTRGARIHTYVGGRVR